MTSLAERLAAIDAAPDGPRIAACFDYDGTIIAGFSAGEFYRHRLRNRELGPIELTKTLILAQRGIHSPADFSAFLDLSLAAWRGKPVEELEQLGRHLFKSAIASRLHYEALELVNAHQAKRHTVVLASSATRFQVEPMAIELGADHVVCTPIEVDADGVLTGRVGGPPAWAEGKADGVRALAETEDLDLEASFAYSNGFEDVAFLEAVGHPCCVEPEDRLVEEAELRGWPILRCAPRGGRPSVADVARTVGFYGSMATAFGAGLGLGALNRSRETLLEITGGVGSDVGLALAGVRVDVLEGQAHLWDARPCVFVFNHQSKLDPIILMKLLRGGFTGVAKKEAANVPGFGQFFRLAGVAFIDRGNRGQWAQALAPAVAKVRDEGLSLVISPEGTRTPTPRLGRFKKGPFHIAMQAGVPMVPIVLRDVGEVMWRGSQAIRPGTVEVVVREAIPTDDWTVETIDDHVAEVRDVFVRTLENWPTGPRKELTA